MTLLFPLHGAGALATEIVCPSESSLAGELETKVGKGFTPNKLHIQETAPSRYFVTLDSYWAPKPFDDGTLDTIGNFQGALVIPKP